MYQASLCILAIAITGAITGMAVAGVTQAGGVITIATMAMVTGSITSQHRHRRRTTGIASTIGVRDLLQATGTVVHLRVIGTKGRLRDAGNLIGL
ncbi:hypothetical protein A8A01_02790 [Ewingella americana]|nr:hypothetical protein A8A01_02790 [Ewingella americana]